VPTVGFGSTRRADGSLIRAGKTITPPEAVRLALAHIAGDETRLRACFGEDTQIAQREWDAFVSLAYNVGAEAVCTSSIPEKLSRGDYAAACKTILDFNGFCAKPKVKNAAGRLVCPPGARKILPGLVRRREAEYRLCMGEAT
jgi:lysozyme